MEILKYGMPFEPIIGDQGVHEHRQQHEDDHRGHPPAVVTHSDDFFGIASQSRAVAGPA